MDTEVRTKSALFMTNFGRYAAWAGYVAFTAGCTWFIVSEAILS